MNEIIERLDKIVTLLEGKTEGRWLGLRQACDYTSLSVSTLRRAIEKGKLEVSMEAGRLIFKEDWLEKWLNKKVTTDVVRCEEGHGRTRVPFGRGESYCKVCNPSDHEYYQNMKAERVAKTQLGQENARALKLMNTIVGND